MADAQAQTVRPIIGKRRRPLPEDRRRQEALVLRQPGAYRKEDGALVWRTEIMAKTNQVERNTSQLGKSRIFTPEVIDDIHIKSELGRYRMR